MKIIIYFFLGAFLFVASGVNLFAQNGEITFILIRHAEKDISPAANKADPDLTAEGRQRAEKLFETVKGYEPSRIFSTIFRRNRETVAPLADKLNPNYRLQVQFYDHAELEDFAEQLMKLNAKTVVVVGHNSTTPDLANLLVKQNKYKHLAETEYNKMWIIKIRRNKDKANVIEDRVIEY